jgi:MgtC family
VWHFLSTASIVPPDGQGLKQLGELALAFVLSSLIGIERECRQKSAGPRTHTLVGTGAALFLIVSKYGFTDVLGPHVILDPSRVAAQIVSGIGFIGGGLIFVRGDAVRGLTTAAIVWITAAIGMACGAGLAILALAATAALHRRVRIPSARGRASPIPIRWILSPRQIRGRPGDPARDPQSQHTPRVLHRPGPDPAA